MSFCVCIFVISLLCVFQLHAQTLKIHASATCEQTIQIPYMRALFGAPPQTVAASHLSKALVCGPPPLACPRPGLGTGCTQASLTDAQNKIAVAARGECTFSAKSGAASTAGAVALIVVETKRRGRAVQMRGEGTLPTVMVTEADWQRLEECVRGGALVSFEEWGGARGGTVEVIARAAVVWVVCKMGVAVVGRLRGRGGRCSGR